jgi:uncharacterized membrane protein
MIITLIVLPILPDTIATHYGLNGPDNFGSKYVMLILPIFCILMGFIWLFSGMFTLKDKDEKRSNQNIRILFWFDIFSSLLFTLITIILLYVSYESTDNIVSRDLDLLSILAIFLSFSGVLFGNLLPKCKQNWIIGIKTKWTLKSEVTWYKTHRVAGKILVIVGIISTLLCLFVFNGFIGLIFYLGISTIQIIPIIIYSYYIYKHEGQIEDQK